MLKRYCKERAEWRLQPGKPSERLSAHYQLNCDYRTAIMTCWEEGGVEPIYLCETHAKEVGRSRESVPSVSTVAAPSVPRDLPLKDNQRTQNQEVARTKPNGSTPAVPVATMVLPKPVPAVKRPSVKSPARDLSFGNPAKALVDEAIWNMATGDFEAYRNALREGKPVTEAAQAAGGQLAMVHRKIGDYTVKLDAVLSESPVTISGAETVDKPLERAMMEMIGNTAMSDSEKDAAIQQLGALEAWVKQGLQGDMTPLEANRIMRAIGDRLNWGGSSSVSEEMKPAYRELYGSLKNALRTAVPEAQNLHERLTNLYAAKSDLDSPPAGKPPRDNQDLANPLCQGQ